MDVPDNPVAKPPPSAQDFDVLMWVVSEMKAAMPTVAELADFVDACNDKLMRGHALSEVEAEMCREHSAAVARCREALDLYESWGL